MIRRDEYTRRVLIMAADAISGPVVWKSCAACHDRYLRREDETGPLADLCTVCIVEVTRRLKEDG